MPLPVEARLFLLFAVVLNVAISLVFEQYGAHVVAGLVGTIISWRKGRHREREGKMYKAVEGGMQ